MVAAETISKETIFALTADQEMTATRIINKFVEQTVEIITPLEESIIGTVQERVIKVCKELDDAGIPKKLISTIVCQKADKFNRSPDWLRRLIPVEYKNQAQRDIRITHVDSSKNLPGGTDSHQHEINADDIEFSHPPPNPNIGAIVKHPSHLIGRKEYDTLKVQFDTSQAEIIKLKKQLDDVVVDIHFLIALAEGNESNEELGEKVRVAVRDDPRYKAYLKKQKLKAKRDGKGKKSKAKQK